ncbi:MAG: nuclear protein [Gemmatimonadetes bacterium]|nr:nuclear protein [Gemmatimonadota bacterium]
MQKPNISAGKVLAMRSSRIHGKGVFARVPIPSGVRLIEYRGKRITNAVADALYPEDRAVPYHTFLFAIDGDVVIDAGRGGNMSRWINHSCDPNCDAVVDDGRVWIESVRDIAPGEELTYDYNFVLDERHTPAAKRRYPCICGAAKCRGTILAKKR